MRKASQRRVIGLTGKGFIGAKAVDILPRHAILPPAFNDLAGEAFWGARYSEKMHGPGIKALAGES